MLEQKDELAREFSEENQRSGGVPGIISYAAKRFNDANASRAAANMAYYPVFSIFALIIAQITAGSFVVDG